MQRSGLMDVGTWNGPGPEISATSVELPEHAALASEAIQFGHKIGTLAIKGRGHLDGFIGQRGTAVARNASIPPSRQAAKHF